MASEKIPFLLRIAESVFILAALCLVAAGVGICKETVMGIRCDTNARLSIDMWDDEGQNDKVKGQYYIFLSSMVLAFLTMGNLLMMITRHPRAKAVGVAITVTGIVLSLLNGCIEAWYAAGYSSSKHGTIYYQTWAAATALYFAATAVYSVDFAIARGLIGANN